jgi:hypothetical protein
VIITTCKPYGVIRGALKKWKKIGIVSCNFCARACETGGKERMDVLAQRLKQDGFEVVDTELVATACNIDLLKRPEYQSDMLVVLACDSGAFTLQTIFPNKMIVPALDTIGLGARDTQGNIFVTKTF